MSRAAHRHLRLPHARALDALGSRRPTVIPQGYVEGVQPGRRRAASCCRPTPEGAERAGRGARRHRRPGAERRARSRPGALRRRARGGHGRADARAPVRDAFELALLREARRRELPRARHLPRPAAAERRARRHARAGRRTGRARPRAAPPAARHVRAAPRDDGGGQPSRPACSGRAVDDIHSHHHQGIAEVGDGLRRLGPRPRRQRRGASRIRRSRSAWPCSGTRRRRPDGAGAPLFRALVEAAAERKRGLVVARGCAGGRRRDGLPVGALLVPDVLDDAQAGRPRRACRRRPTPSGAPGRSRTGSSRSGCRSRARRP